MQSSTNLSSNVGIQGDGGFCVEVLRFWTWIRIRIRNQIYSLLVIQNPDSDAVKCGIVTPLILTNQHINFFFSQIHDLPKPSYFTRSIGDLDIGTYDNIEVAHNDTPIIEALNKFVGFRISALPIVDDEHKLIDIYAKFDVIVSESSSEKVL